MTRIPAQDQDDGAPVINEEATTQLAAELMRCVKCHYERRPTDRMTAFEILNALGIVSGVVIAGTDADGRAFFDLALAQATQDMHQP